VVVIRDEGFLPEDVMSVTGWCCGEERPCDRGTPRARYFNEIERPDYWEITADSSGGSVYDKSHLRGRIVYSAPGNTRLVKRVEWLDESGTPRMTDHYNQAGRLYARSTADGTGRRIITAWFDAQGQERLTENAVTGDLILHTGSPSGGTMRIYKNRTQLVLALFRKLGLTGERIFYNSLSTPFFVSEALPSAGRKHLLFWQEPPRSDVPGNMLGILHGSSCTERVLVQNRASFDALVEHGADAAMLRLFGYLYSYSRENGYGREMLICTNSDQIESLEALAEALPEMHFHIAAVTEMSTKLLSMDRYPNVTLYPVARPAVFHKLYAMCDYYLDINYGSEIVSAVKEAFLHNLLILAFVKTQHNRTYTAPEHIFQDAGVMAAAIREAASTPAAMDRHLACQRQAALSEKESAYQDLFVSDAAEEPEAD